MCSAWLSVRVAVVHYRVPIDDEGCAWQVVFTPSLTASPPSGAMLQLVCFTSRSHPN